MYDKGLVPKKEYARKLINQGMILGMSAYVFFVVARFEKGKEFFIAISQNLAKDYEKAIKNWRIKHSDRSKAFRYSVLNAIHVDISLVNSSNELDIDELKKWREDFENAIFLLEDGRYIVGREVEKMSKSKYNVVNPDAICEEYGADSLRLYEMFLGPLEQAKPWNTAGITGVHGFLKKLWRLYHTGIGGEFAVTDDPASGDALKVLHKTIKKVEEDIETFSFNTTVSTFMICVNELGSLKCTSREVLEPLAVLISPYAPHIAEELWEKLGNHPSIATAAFPEFEAKYLVEDTKEYPVSFNGKLRFTLSLPLDLSKEQIEAAVMAHEKTRQQLDGSSPKKVIVVPGKIVNIVV
jgi:leucyl-tRNA synthetase